MPQESCRSASAPSPGVSGDLKKISVVLHAAGDGVGGVTEQTGVHVVEQDIVMRQGKMRKGSERHAAFQHAAHHAGDAILFANRVDPVGFEDAAGFRKFDIDIIAGVCGNESLRVVVIEDAFIRHDFYGRQ